MRRAAVLLVLFGLVLPVLSLYAKETLPEDQAIVTYQALSACEKQNHLWENVKNTKYEKLPEFNKFGFWQMLRLGFQNLAPKRDAESDFAPKGWKKYLHARAVMAKVKLVALHSDYTGVFQGADCALLRLSLTFRPSGSRAVAPGMALKVLRDGVASGNVSALVSLEGQEKDFNFLKNPMSNIVPIGKGFGQKLVHKIFRKLSPYPEELVTENLAHFDAHGVAAQNVIAPRQLFFVPTPGLAFPSSSHDVREDMLKVPAGTKLYQIRAVSSRHAGFDYANYTAETAAQFLEDSEPVADVVTTSDFIASKFGDEGMFFKHQLRP